MSDLFSDIGFIPVAFVINLLVRIILLIGFIRRYKDMTDKSWMRKNELYPGPGKKN